MDSTANLIALAGLAVVLVTVFIGLMRSVFRLSDDVSELKEIMERWFPDFSPEDLTTSPRPSMISVARDHNHRITNLENAQQLLVDMDRRTRSMEGMLGDILARQQEIEDRLNRVEQHAG